MNDGHVGLKLAAAVRADRRLNQIFLYTKIKHSSFSFY